MVSWSRDGIPTQGREAITKGKTHSQFLISSSQRSDAGVYRAHLKNDYGEAHYDISGRVTGEGRRASGKLSYTNRWILLLTQWWSCAYLYRNN